MLSSEELEEFIYSTTECSCIFPSNKTAAKKLFSFIVCIVPTYSRSFTHSAPCKVEKHQVIRTVKVK